MSDTIILNSVSQIHQSLGLAKPKHPLVTVVQAKDIKTDAEFRDVRIIVNLYQVALKKGIKGRLRYGRNSYDYQEGTLVFTAPGQVLEYEQAADADSGTYEGWSLVFHPDLIRKSDLADKIDDYTFFGYDTNEALHLSDTERSNIEELLDKITLEYSQNLDRHSLHLINSNIEMLLDYCLRYYDRQFFTRTNLNKDVISKFEKLLKNYYKSQEDSALSLPTLPYCASELNLSPTYLSDLLRKETGKSAQEHIHLFIIEKAKNTLLNSKRSISEIAYSLGFDYPQHFSNLFKSKTGFSPRAYRNMN
ncbi:MAG: AraC family transcriptional regulator [Saprospiraceae bacterium]|nr:AraC family transcriptional regulator [Saprospiraceae bacterium]